MPVEMYDLKDRFRAKFRMGYSKFVGDKLGFVVGTRYLVYS